MDGGGDSIEDSVVKPKLHSDNLTSEDLKKHLVFTFGDLRTAGQRAGFGDDTRVAQILAGYKVPKSPALIHRLSLAWNIDLVILTQLFDKLRRGVLM